MAKYVEIYEYIVKCIQDGTYTAGAKIPSETELMELFHASRGTVRKAVDVLHERGYVHKQHGKGAFVLERSNIELQLGQLISFQEVHEARHDKAMTTTVLHFGEHEANDKLSDILQVPLRTKVIKIVRIRQVNGMNAIVDVNYFVADRVPHLTEDIAATSIYAHIEGTLQLTISYAERTIEAERATTLDREQLQLKDGHYVIVVRNVVHFQDGTPFEYTESRHKLDAFYFKDIARR